MSSRNLYREVSERILTELRNGALPWVKPWSAVAGSGQVCNGSTNRPYSGVNVVLLWMTMQAAGYSVPRFVTFQQAKQHGGTVRKGEKATKIYFVSAIETKDKDTGEDKRIPFLKEYNVFNVAQCDGLPESVTKAGTVKPRNADERDPLIDEFTKATLCDLRHGEAQAYYRPHSDYVMMPEFISFKTADNYYATLFHELGHWTGAERRLNRTFGKRFGDSQYAAEELVAELTAAFLCAEFSVDGDIRHAGYIQSWIKMLEKDDKAFFTAASAAQKAADYLRGLALAEPEVELGMAA